MLKPIIKIKNTPNQILEDQCQRIHIQIHNSQAIFIMTGQELNLKTRIWNTHSQILEDPCQRTLTLIHNSQAIFITIGL
jgi:hypothetical protein